MNAPNDETNAAIAPLRLAVIGLGRAGQARLRDIDAAQDLILVDAVGGRAGADVHHRLIANPDVDAVLICTENAKHASLARAAIAAGRHVLVEFPLASSADESAALLALAAQRGVVLQLELIGLLTERHRGLAARASAIATIDVAFAGGRYRWVDDELALGRHGQLAIGRLHALWDLCGPLTLQTATRSDEGETSILVAAMVGAAGQRLRLEERRGPDIARTSALICRDASGDEVVPTPVEAHALGLFATDLAMFAARIRRPHHVHGYVSADAIVGVARLADDISAAVASDGVEL